jgi:hypothetical protein
MDELDKAKLAMLLENLKMPRPRYARALRIGADAIVYQLEDEPESERVDATDKTSS